MWIITGTVTLKLQGQTHLVGFYTMAPILLVVEDNLPSVRNELFVKHALQL